MLARALGEEEALAPNPRGFRACYLHPRKPAIRNCSSCERPICKECEEESGDKLLCAPCKQALSPSREERAQTPSGPPASRGEPFMPGEFTVFDDGTVVSPEPSAIARPETAPEAGTVATGETPRSPTAVPEKREEEELSTRPDKSTGPLSQMAYALPYGLGAGVLVAGLWLLIALFSDQWTQVSVFSLGVVVPWALFNSTTRKKRLGRRVWTETPPVWMISAMSFAIVAVFTPLLELMAYNVLYGSNPSKLPFSDFVQRYMKGADWFMVSCGLVLALLVPFLLKLGVEWSKPSFRKASGEPPPLAEDEQVEANADDPGEEPTPRSLPGEDESDAENEDNPDDPQ